MSMAAILAQMGYVGKRTKTALAKALDRSVRTLHLKREKAVAEDKIIEPPIT